MLRFLLFLFLCIIALMLIRALQGGTGRSGEGTAGPFRKRPPAAPPKDVIDVRYEDLPDSDGGRERKDEAKQNHD